MAWSVLTWKIRRIFQSLFLFGEVRAETRHSPYTKTLAVIRMTKTDKSKHTISIASIKRSTFKPYDYKLTKFYESNLEFSDSGIKIELNKNELIICSTIVNLENYSVLTTQKL